MYKDHLLPSSILIVKTSSLGDIIQSFNVLDAIHKIIPGVQIDWVVEALFCPIVEAHPLVRKAIPLDIKGRKNLFQGIRGLRKERYDLILDLQANTKSGAITLLARGKNKVGYGLRSVREWPNILATKTRFDISKEKNIRVFYLELIEKYFGTLPKDDFEGVRFLISDREKGEIQKILRKVPGTNKIMVCPGSKWPNKQLNEGTLAAFLKRIETEYNASFLLIWGASDEKELCERLKVQLRTSLVVNKLSIPMWQNLINETDLVIAVDSSALHLAGTTQTPSFSIFGPTSFEVFKPIGKRHFGIQGRCPYNQHFLKQCPILRSCSTGACMKDFKVEELFQAFQSQCGFLQRESPPQFFPDPPSEF